MSHMDIGKVFDTASSIVDTFSEGQFHLPYWYDERDDASFVTAAHRVTRKVVGSLGVGDGDRLLDAGCGSGASAVMVAAETGAQVTGVSLSEYEIAEARNRAKQSGVGDRLSFEREDYASLPYPDGSFDAVMAIESLLCAPDLGRVLAEFFRVLKPGGGVSLCHCTRQAAMPPELETSFLTSIGAQRLPSTEEWVEALRNAGFAFDEYTQCGPRTYGMRDRYLAAVDAHKDELEARVGVEHARQFRQSVERYFSPGPDNVGYAIVTGHKPATP